MFSSAKTKTNPNFAVNLRKGATIHFYCLFDESHFSNILIMECIKLYWLCKHIKKIRSSQPAIPVLNWVKHQSFPMSIVKFLFFLGQSVTKILRLISLQRCDCIWVGRSCHSGSLCLRHNIELGRGCIMIDIYCTLSNVFKILTGFDKVSIYLRLTVVLNINDSVLVSIYSIMSEK